jgi:hypothetical protein
MVEFAADADDALLRVLSTLHRRRCRVTAAEFAADRRASGQLALRIQAPAAHAGRVAHWLNSLVDVRNVWTAPAAVSPGAGRQPRFVPADDSLAPAAGPREATAR